MRQGPRRAARLRWKWLRRAAIAQAAVAVALGLVVWRFGWTAPPAYSPGDGIEVRAEFLDSAGHDARVGTLGDGPYVLHIERDGGALLFFGSRHSKDPGHPQLADLRRAWAGFRPTVALVEGRMSFFVGTATQGVRVFGEGAAVYALAEGAGVPLYTLEPPLEDEIRALDEIGDRKQVALFRTLSVYVSAQRGGPVSDFKVRRILSRHAAPLTDGLATIDDLDRYFAAEFPTLGPWRDIPEQAIWPGRTATWLNRMATRSSRVRDEHFVRVLLDLVQRGERALAIAGRSHAVMLEPPLWATLQPARRGAFSSLRPWE